MTIEEVQRLHPGFCRDHCCAGRFGWCAAYIDNPGQVCIYPNIEREVSLWQMERKT